MQLDRILIHEEADQYESLALALQAVAAPAGAELDYDDVCAALGVSFAAVSTQDASPAWWMTYGRDAFAVPAARLFGIELRDLHPPDVGLDMAAAEEYPLHFEDSYRPLILAALHNGQPVLAWQGWPGFRAPFWGVITGLADGRLEGTTLWAGGERQPLAQPARQCYVVERCEPRRPGRRDLFAAAMRHADAYMNRAVFASASPRAGLPPIITGPAAFDAWERWLASDAVVPVGTPRGSGGPGDPDPHGGPPCTSVQGSLSWNEHRQHAEFVASARVSAGRFLRRMLEVVEPGHREQVAEAADGCASLIERLAESREEQTVRSLFAASRGREKLLAAVHAAEADDRQLAMRVERLASSRVRGSGFSEEDPSFLAGL